MVKSKKKIRKIKISRTPVTRKEVTRLGGALRALGSLAGGTLGTLVGAPSGGASVGSSLGAALSRWLGSGDYTVASNSIVQRTLKGSESIPSMHTGGQTVVVRHREFLGEIQGAENFTVRRELALNPGNSETFPWLSKIASRFQEYRIRGLVFHYVPSSGAAVSSTNPALGTVMIQTTYRSNDVKPDSKVEMLNEYWSSEAVPSEPFCHPIECDPKENPFNVQYVRTGTVPTGDSTLLYDLGRTYVAVSGQQAADKVLGDLWVTYEIELKKPVIATNVTSTHVSRAASYTGGSVVPGNWFNGTVGSWGALNVYVTTPNTLTFNQGLAGTYFIFVTLTATTNFTACDLSGSPTLVNCVGKTFMPGIGATYVRTVVGGGTPTANRGFYCTAITITDPSKQASITFPNGTFTGASTESTFLVTPMDLIVP